MVTLYIAQFPSKQYMKLTTDSDAIPPDVEQLATERYSDDIAGYNRMMMLPARINGLKTFYEGCAWTVEVEA